MSKLGLKTHLLTIEDRQFLLKELNNTRSDEIDDLAFEATQLRAKLEALAPEQIEEKRALKKDIRRCNFATYRALLIPVEPAEQPSDEWLSENMGVGYFEHEIVPLQQILNAHQDVLGNSIAQAVSVPAVTPDAPSTGPVFAAR